MTTKGSLTYFVNDIPRGVLEQGLLSFLASLTNGSLLAEFDVGHYTGGSPISQFSEDLGDFKALVERITLTDSLLDDELSVATITFKDTPRWFKNREQDPYGFPKKTKMGTIWKGVDMALKDGDGRTAFLRAVIDGNLQLAETLAEYKETSVNASDNQGMTALHWACKNGTTDLVAFCLSIPRLDVSVKSKAGLTAFDIAYRQAVWDDNDAIPTLFYKSIFDMDEYDPDNALLRLLTITSDSRGKTLFPQEALFGPARNGNLALMQALLPNIIPAGPVATNKYKETALHMAAGGGHTAIVALLIGCKYSDINAVTGDGCTALHYAARGGYTDTVMELGRHKINLDTEDSRGYTAAILAAQNGHQSTARILVEMGAKMVGGIEKYEKRDCKDSNVKAEVMLRMDELLLKRGGDINGRNEQGLMPLHEAVFSCDTELVRILLDAGADIEGKFLTWKSPLEIAKQRGNDALVALLLERGARTVEQNSREREQKPSLPIEYASLSTRSGPIIPSPLQIENVVHVADPKADEFDDVTEMELPLDHEADAGIYSPDFGNYPSRSASPDNDNDSYQETLSPDAHHSQNDTPSPAVVPPSRISTPESMRHEDSEHQQEALYANDTNDDNDYNGPNDAEQGHGWTSPARSMSPENVNNEYSGGYGSDYEGGDYYGGYNQSQHDEDYNDDYD